MSNATLMKIKIEPNDFSLDQSLDLDKSPSIDNDADSDLVESESIKSENDAGFKEIQFCNFSNSTIKLVADQTISTSVSDSAANILAEDLSYRVRELIHSSGQFMRHSCRSKLTTKDVSKAMQELDCDIIFGHNNAHQNNTETENYYQFVPQVGVFVENDIIIDLHQETRIILKKRLKEINDEKSSKSSNSFKVQWFQPKEFVCDKFYQFSDSCQFLAIEKYFNIIFDIILTSRGSKFNNVPLFERKRLLKVICYDLAVNRNIKPLFNLLIYFIGLTLRTWNKLCLPKNADLSIFSRTKLESYTVYLNVIHSIIRNNQFVDIALNSNVIKELTDILLTICLEPLLNQTPSASQSPQSYLLLFCHAMRIRSKSAHLFGQVFFRFCLPFTNTQQQLLSALLLKIRTCKNQLKSEDFFNISAIDYSILVLFRYLGFDMCLRTLQPMLLDDNSSFNIYFDEKYLQGGDKRNLLWEHTRTFIRAEICHVGELIMKGLNLLLANVANDFVQVQQSDTIYSYYSKHFSDSLSIRLVPLLELSVVQQNRNKWVGNWRKQFVGSQKSCDKQPEQSPIKPTTDNSENVAKNSTDTSPNKNRKKKSARLLESMLFTDTTQLPKNQSLSMFTESLFEVSLEKPSCTYLYQEDCEESTLSRNTLIVFDGQRLKIRSDDNDGMFFCY